MKEQLLRTTTLSWEPALEGWLMLAAWFLLAAALAASLYGYRGVDPRKRLLLSALRLVAIANLAMVLAGPARVHTEGQQRRDPLAVLIDGSRSMRVQDVDGAARSSAVEAWLASRSGAFERLSEEHRLRFFLVGDGLEPWTPSAALPSDGTSTDLGQALFGLQEALAGEYPAGVLLVSDGADRSALGRALRSEGEAGVKRLTEGLAFPVSTWTLGSEAGPPDLSVSLKLPPFGFVRRPLAVEASVQLSSLQAREIDVLLREDGEIISIRSLRLEQGDPQVVSFEVKPDQVGFHTYRVEVPTLSGDAIVENNSAEATVKVVRDRTRVLQVTSRPSWDVKFLRRLLKTDPNIDLVSFFILRNSERKGPLVRNGGELSLIAFPYEELFTEDLQGFDLVIFQNFWFGSFMRHPSDRFLLNLVDYVRAGGAFLLIGGDPAFGEGDYGNSPLAEVMPTDIPAGAARPDRFRAVLTETGQRHPITRLDRDEARNQSRWKQLPMLQNLNPLGSLRRGAVALLSAGQSGGLLAAARSVGKGRTMAFANDETWRWSMSGASDRSAGREHALFWRNAIRWLVKDVEQEQVQVILDAENYDLGDPVQVQVRVLGENYAPRANMEVVGSVGPLDGESWQELSERTDADGQITVTTTAREEGVMVARVDVVGVPDPFGHAEARASVVERRGELADPRSRADLMAALSEATGGAVLQGEAPDPRDMERRPANTLLAMERRVEVLWSRWWWLLLAVVPLGVEWTLRRRLGLR